MTQLAPMQFTSSTSSTAKTRLVSSRRTVGSFGGPAVAARFAPSLTIVPMIVVMSVSPTRMYAIVMALPALVTGARSP
eukprot:scaffold101683_cov63-Phaeocystis_antarctica.AAC.3